MAWIRTIDPSEQPSGLLGTLYDAAIKRAGRVWNIVRLMSLRPRQVESSMDFYQVVMMGTSELSRAERELVATVVSATNGCHY